MTAAAAVLSNAQVARLDCTTAAAPGSLNTHNLPPPLDTSFTRFHCAHTYYSLHSCYTYLHIFTSFVPSRLHAYACFSPGTVAFYNSRHAVVAARAMRFVGGCCHTRPRFTVSCQFLPGLWFTALGLFCLRCFCTVSTRTVFTHLSRTAFSRRPPRSSFLEPHALRHCTTRHAPCTVYSAGWTTTTFTVVTLPAARYLSCRPVPRQFSPTVSPSLPFQRLYTLRTPRLVAPHKPFTSSVRFTDLTHGSFRCIYTRAFARAFTHRLPTRLPRLQGLGLCTFGDTLSALVLFMHGLPFTWTSHHICSLCTPPWFRVCFRTLICTYWDCTLSLHTMSFLVMPFSYTLSAFSTAWFRLCSFVRLVTTTSVSRWTACILQVYTYFHKFSHY